MTHENRRRLRGVYNLCKRKASSVISKTKMVGIISSDGLSTLGRVIHLMEIDD